MAGQTGQQDIARRYATAFFALAQEQGQLDAIAKDMAVLSALDAASGFDAVAANPTLPRAVQADAMAALAAHLKLSTLTHKLLGTLAERRRLPLTAAVAAETQALIDAQKGEMTAHVTAAQALDQSQIDAIAAVLSKGTGKKVRVSLDIDAGIIGGLIIRAGSKRIDASLRTKLERMHRALRNSNNSQTQKKMKEVA